MTDTETPIKKARVLLPGELELIDALVLALLGKATAEAAVIVNRREVGRLTREINRISFDDKGKPKPGLLRSTVIWAEARDKLGASPALTQEQLAKGA